MCVTPVKLGGISGRQLLSAQQLKEACCLQWRDMTKSKGIRRFRQLFSQWITYICLKRLPSRGTVQENMEKEECKIWEGVAF